VSHDPAHLPPPRLKVCPPSSISAGFSLIELLVVMAIIIILFTMYFSSGARDYQVKKIAACQKNLENVYVAMKTYAQDNHDHLPGLIGARTSEEPLSQLAPRYTTGTEFFICPGSGDAQLPDAKPFADRRISYAYYMGRNVTDGADQPLVSDRQVNALSKPAGVLLFSADGKKPGNNHNKYGGNVMFCDGNVQASGPGAAFPLPCPPNIILLNPKP
jgi:prepilin-type N-terminal cleavage/methylation domain-containing protein/prepilin-type processing-associated H-X9-DG protein